MSAWQLNSDLVYVLRLELATLRRDVRAYLVSARAARRFGAEEFYWFFCLRAQANRAAARTCARVLRTARPS